MEFNEDILVELNLRVVVFSFKLLRLIEVRVDDPSHFGNLIIPSTLDKPPLTLQILSRSRPLIFLKKYWSINLLCFLFNFSSSSGLSFKALFSLELPKIVALISFIKEHVLESIAEIRR